MSNDWELLARTRLPPGETIRSVHNAVVPTVGNVEAARDVVAEAIVQALMRLSTRHGSSASRAGR